MGVDIVVGAQGGDEGKGKIAEYLAKSGDYEIVLRVSSPQAGHSIVENGEKFALASLPCGYKDSNARVLLGRGSLIYVPKLLKEIEKTGLNSERVGIDNFATIVTEEHLQEERNNAHLMGNIGSVGSGVAPCRRQKLMRDSNLKFAKDIPELAPYTTDSIEEIYRVLKKNGKNKGKILFEGDHGFKLSLIGEEYPYVTSRDTAVSSYLGEAGINPFEISDVYLVLKPYVTRVGPGFLEKEILDENIKEWFHNFGGEIGSVSKRKRRIGKIEWGNLLKASMINGASKLCVTHMDMFKENFAEEFFGTEQDFLDELHENIVCEYPYPKLSLLSYGPKLEDIVNV